MSAAQTFGVTVEHLVEVSFIQNLLEVREGESAPVVIRYRVAGLAAASEDGAAFGASRHRLSGGFRT